MSENNLNCATLNTEVDTYGVSVYLTRNGSHVKDFFFNTEEQRTGFIEVNKENPTYTVLPIPKSHSEELELCQRK